LVHCFQNIWFNKRTHPNAPHWAYGVNEMGTGTACGTGSDQSSVGRLRQGGVPEGAVH